MFPPGGCIKGFDFLFSLKRILIIIVENVDNFTLFTIIKELKNIENFFNGFVFYVVVNGVFTISFEFSVITNWSILDI